MLTTGDILNIFLPVLSHWIVWLIFLLVVIMTVLVYCYPYMKKPRKEFHYQHITLPITAIISLYIFAKMLEGVIYQGSILKVDSWFNAIMTSLHSPIVTRIALFITNFGSTVVVSILVVVIIGALLYRKRWRYALLSAVAIIGAEILMTIIKNIVQRTRPVNLLETGFSFPSGHAITAIVFLSLLIYSFKDDFKNLVTRYVLITLFSILFVSVAISRIILNVHWFSDVVAGMSLGLFWFMLLVLIARSIPGVAPAIKVETKEAKPIVPKEVVKTAKKMVPAVVGK